MTIRFAAARTGKSTPLTDVLRRPVIDHVANDDGPSANSHLLDQALRHFSEFGLAAPQEARTRAERAFFAGDRESYDRWRAICEMFDRRAGRSLAAIERQRDNENAG